MENEEVWVEIPNYDGAYWVSNFGSVKSLKNNKERILKLYLDTNGYLNAKLCKNGVQKNGRVHILVGMCFLGYTPNGKHDVVVDHKDNIKTNNRLSNLQIITNRLNLTKDKRNKSSRFSGVDWNKARNKWRARLYLNGKYITLGYYPKDKEEDAHAAYLKALKPIISKKTT